MNDLIRREDVIEAVRVCDVFLAYQGEKIANNIDGFVDSMVEQMRDNISRAVSALPSAEAVQGWIPCSERLPKAENMYQPPGQRYLCQLEAYGERKFCVLSRLKGAVSPFWDWYGIAIYDSEVTAWMPLPTPYKGGDTE